jgi:YD repeat-containing protein
MYKNENRVCKTITSENEEDNTETMTTILINNNTIEQVVNYNDNSQTRTIKGEDGDCLVYTSLTVNDDGSREIRNINGDSYVYKYDNEGNIRSIICGDNDIITYEYDTIQQVTRENDSIAGTTTVFTYDKGGNITTKKVYNYTTGEVTGTPIKVNTYSYDDSEWRDLLTSYNGQAITYDEIGNPLQYRDGYNFTWTNGRSLKSVKKAGVETSYKYNQNGYRTSKTVNGKTTKYTLEDMSIVKEETDGQTIWYIYDGDGELVGFELNAPRYSAPLTP